MAAACWF